MENNSACSGKKGIKCLIPVTAVFITLFLFQWLFHGVYMMPQYEATASMWRSHAEIESMMWVCIVTKLVMAMAVSCLYCMLSDSCPTQGKSLRKGATFGFKIGLLLGAHDFASYAWMPIDMNMALSWFVGDLLMGILIGVALALSFRVCKKGV